MIITNKWQQKDKTRGGAKVAKVPAKPAPAATPAAPGAGKVIYINGRYTKTLRGVRK